MFDTRPLYAKLANNEALTEDEIVSLLKTVDGYQTATAWLSSCEAATLEGLPKSTSKSERARHVSICRTAARTLEGDMHCIPYPTTAVAALERCLRAIADHEVPSASTKPLKKTKSAELPA